MEMKTIVISGGCGLLGKEFAETLLGVGYDIIILDLPSKIRKGSNTFIAYYGVDITKEDEVEKAIYDISIGFGLDILINCTAINPIPNKNMDNSFQNYSLNKWKKTLDVNLTGAFLLSKTCIKYMLKNETEGFKGTIINIASDLGIITSDQSIYENGYIKPPDYGVSKAGLIHLTKYIASYYGNTIKSVCLTPGSVYNGQSDTLKGNLESRIPIGRLARVDEYNGAIKFLCSQNSDYMQGQSLVMDGGRTIW